MEITYSDVKAYCRGCDRPSIEPADAVWTERRICSPCHVRELEAEIDRLRAALYDTRKLHAYDDDHPCEACREELAADG